MQKQIPLLRRGVTDRKTMRSERLHPRRKASRTEGFLRMRRQVSFIATDSATGTVADLSCLVGRCSGNAGSAKAADECEFRGGWCGVVAELEADSIYVARVSGVQR